MCVQGDVQLHASHKQLLLEVCVCHAHITCASVCMQYNIQENKA